MSVQVSSPPVGHSEAKTCASVEVQTTMPSSDMSECGVERMTQVWHTMMIFLSGDAAINYQCDTVFLVQATPTDSKEGMFASQSTQTDGDLNGGDSHGLKNKWQVWIHVTDVLPSSHDHKLL